MSMQTYFFDTETATATEQHATLQLPFFGRQDLSAFWQTVTSGQKCQIDSSLFYYLLELKIPVFTNSPATLPDGETVQASFGYAGQDSPVIIFWKTGEPDGQTGYFCQQSDWQNPYDELF